MVWFCFRSRGLAKKAKKEKEEQKKQSTGDKGGVARDRESLKISSDKMKQFFPSTSELVL